MRKFAILILIIAAIVLYVWFNPSLFHEQSRELRRLYGNVDVRQVDLGFRANGRLILMAFQEGNEVKKGQLMAMLDKQPYLDVVNQEAARVKSLEFALQNAEDVLKRRAELLGTLGVSKEDYENAESARDQLAANLREAKAAHEAALTNLRDTELYAPADGIILTRVREPGTIMREGDPVYTLSLVDPVWIRTFVTEPQLGLIAPGMQVEVQEHNKSWKGRVGFISPISEFTPKTVETPQLRTELVYRIRVIAENPDRNLRQGMPVTIVLPSGGRSTSPASGESQYTTKSE